MQETPAPDGLALADQESRADAADSPAGAVVRALAQPWTAVFAVLVATSAVYAPVLGQWFAQDDVLLTRAGRLFGFREYAGYAFDFRTFEPLHFYAYRPLYFITSDIFYIAFGLNAAPWHAFSLAMHLVNVVLVWLVARRLIESRWLPVMAAAVFALHPVYAYTILWISGMNAVVATTGQLVCLLAFLEYMRTSSRAWYATSVVAYGVALLYHQEIFLVPVALYLWYALQRCHSPIDAVRPRLLALFAPFALELAIFLYVQGYNSQQSGFISSFAPSRGLASMIIGTLSVSLIPHGGLDISRRDIAVAGLALALVAYTYWRAPRRRKLVAFAAAWYALSLVLSVVYIANGFSHAAIAAMPRKLYDAGPALGLMFALTAVTLWGDLRPRLPETAVLVPPAIALVVASAFVWRQGRDVMDVVDGRSAEIERYHDALVSAYPGASGGDTFYLAETPPGLLYACALKDAGEGAGIQANTTTLCYATNLLETMYGAVNVRFVSKQKALDPAFSSGLGADGHVFCYRCGG